MEKTSPHKKEPVKVYGGQRKLKKGKKGKHEGSGPEHRIGCGPSRKGKLEKCEPSKKKKKKNDQREKGEENPHRDFLVIAVDR